jgi:hypothetical protein
VSFADAKDVLMFSLAMVRNEILQVEMMLERMFAMMKIKTTQEKGFTKSEYMVQMK